MANSNDDGWAVWVVIFGLIAWFAWGGKPLEERKDYLTGYDVGHADGYDDGRMRGQEEGREEICDEVESRLNYGAANAVGC